MTYFFFSYIFISYSFVLIRLLPSRNLFKHMVMMCKKLYNATKISVNCNIFNTNKYYPANDTTVFQAIYRRRFLFNAAYWIFIKLKCNEYIPCVYNYNDAIQYTFSVHTNKRAYLVQFVTFLWCMHTDNQFRDMGIV